MARRLVDVPFSPARFPFFYGWWIVAVSTIGVIMSIPGQTMGVSVFTDDLVEAVGTSRVGLSTAYLIGTVASGLTLPFGGRWLDRFGARATATAASVGLGLTLMYLSVVDRVAARGGLLALGALTVGFYALRLSGQGMLTMVSRTMLGRWFDARRGLASGVSSVFVGFGFGVAPLVLDWMIQGAGWRGAWREMAVVVGVGMAAVAIVFYRDRPEDCGLEMDGGPSEEGAVARVERSTTRAEALRTTAFWAVTFALATQALVITAITFHVVDLGASAGLDRAAAVAIFLPMSVVSTVTALIGGWLGDRLRVKHLLMVMMVAQAVGVAASARLDVAYPLAALGLGVAGGLFGPIATIAFPRFFGRTHLGAIVGVETMCMVIGSAIGPFVLAFGEDVTGSYAWPLGLFLVLPASALMLVRRIPAALDRA